jgi:hypothetical protein
MISAMPRVWLAAAGAALALALYGAPCAAEQATPQRSEFAWRTPIQVPAGAGVVRIDLPGPALAQLQSSDASDLRIYNAAGEAVAFSRMHAATAAAPVARTQGYPALPLYSAAATAGRPQGAVQVRIEAPGRQNSVWVQMNGADVSGAPRLSSVLFSMKDERQPLGAIEVQATLPANTPIRISAFSSADLAQWTPVPVRGRLYRFDGAAAPVNMTLEFEQPVNLEGRYLRLDWTGQEGVSIAAVTGIVAAAQPPARVRVELPALKPAAGGTMELATGFLTPMAGLEISSSRDNSLLPLRILGRNEPGQPWRQLGQTVVYRLGSGGADGINPPAALHGASARWLRLESINAADLSGAGLAASAEFVPVQLVFLATGAGPFELAAGRAATAPAALPLNMISSALGNRKLEDLPLASLGPAVRQGPPEPGWLAAAWPGLAPNQSIVLWGVLLLGVVLLAGVAWSLLRQLKTRPPTQT